MNLEDQVCSLELAKKLKELGVKQKSFFYYELISLTNEYHVSWDFSDGKGEYSSFTVAELLELLPFEIFNNFNYGLVIKKSYNDFEVIYDTYTIDGDDNRNFQLKYEFDKNPANACAKMLIYLIENNLINID